MKLQGEKGTDVKARLNFTAERTSGPCHLWTYFQTLRVSFYNTTLTDFLPPQRRRLKKGDVSFQKFISLLAEMHLGCSPNLFLAPLVTRKEEAVLTLYETKMLLDHHSLPGVAEEINSPKRPSLQS